MEQASGMCFFLSTWHVRQFGNVRRHQWNKRAACAFSRAHDMYNNLATSDDTNGTSERHVFLLEHMTCTAIWQRPPWLKSWVFVERPPSFRLRVVRPNRTLIHRNSKLLHLTDWLSQVCELPDMFVCIIFLSVSGCRQTNPLSPPALTDHLEPLWAPLLHYRAMLPLSQKVW